MSLLPYILLGLSSFFFTIVPVSASTILNPLLSLLVPAHVAVSMTAFFFALNSSTKAIVFRKDIQFDYVKKILPVSLIAGIVGAYLVGLFPEELLLAAILILSVYFLIKVILDLVRPVKKKKKTNQIVLHGASVAAGFLQGLGLGGGGTLRKSYLLSEGLSLLQMNGTTSVIGATIFIASVVTRLSTNQVEIEHLYPVLTALPLIVISQWLARHVLKKLSKKTTNIITLVVMTVAVILFGAKFFGV